MKTPNAQGNRRSSATPYIGGLIGLGIWGIALVGALTLQMYQLFPEWVHDLESVEFIGSICWLVAFPVIYVGYFFIWGEKGLTHPWIGSLAFHIVAGLCLWVFLGAAVGQFVSMLILRRRDENGPAP